MDEFLAACRVDDAVFELRPDYRALLLAVDGLGGAPADASIADELIDAAEDRARDLLADTPVEELPHIAAWREAYRAFGAKPQRTRNSLEALTRRAADGLPRINPLTDIYNSISVLHQIPLGGEDRTGYRGAAHLVRATGDEVFDTVAGGDEVNDPPAVGEVIWRDDDGVTCRRWNWRQGRRTRLTEGTGRALFILDALVPMTDDELTAVADDLIASLDRLAGGVTAARRLLAAG